MSPSPDYNSADDVNYEVRIRAQNPTQASRRRDDVRSPRAARPKSFNGMHRRRARRISW